MEAIKTVAVWSTLLILAHVRPAFSYGPESSGPLEPLYGINAPSGWQDYVFSEVPLALSGTTVSISVHACADLTDPNEFVHVNAVGGKVFGNLFTGDSGTGCAGDCDTEYVTMTAGEWNAARASGSGGIGGVLLQFTPSPAVTNICCSDTCSSSGPGGSSECCPTQCTPIPCYIGSISVTVTYTEAECEVDDYCDDGVFCNGAETCVDYECQEGPGNPCDPLGLSCDEDADQCWSDCNSNGVYDDLDIHGSTSHDCNDNDLPDECDLVAMTSDDCNTNNVPDECDVANLGGGFDDSSFWATFDPGASGVGTAPNGYQGGRRSTRSTRIHGDASIRHMDPLLRLASELLIPGTARVRFWE